MCQFSWRFQQSVSTKSKLSSRCSFYCCSLSLLLHLLKPEIVSFFFNFSYSGFVLFLRLECCERCPTNSVQCQTLSKMMKVDWFFGCVFQGEVSDIFEKLLVAEIGAIYFLFAYFSLWKCFKHSACYFKH